MIRVLQAIGTMNYGGAETLVMELYRHIDRTKVQFDFLVFSYGTDVGSYDEEIKKLGGKIYYAEKRLYREPIAYLKEISDFIKSHPEYRICHSHLNMRGGFVLYPCKKNGVSVTVAHSHTAYPGTSAKDKIANTIGRILVKKNSDYYFGCSSDAVNTLCGKREDGKTRFLLHNAIDTDKFLFSRENRSKVRKEFNVDDKTKVFVNVARFTGEKNHRFIVRIFKNILENNEDSVLLFVGKGDLQQSIREYAKELGVSDKVRFLGARSDVNEILSAADAFIFPSKGEGLGIVAIEAQANGLPCIMSKDVIPKEADVGSGLVTRVGLEESTEFWADKCIEALSKGRLSPENAQKSVIEAGYDIKSTAKWLQNFYLNHWKNQ